MISRPPTGGKLRLGKCLAPARGAGACNKRARSAHTIRALPPRPGTGAPPAPGSEPGIRAMGGGRCRRAAGKWRDIIRPRSSPQQARRAPALRRTATREHDRGRVIRFELPASRCSRTSGTQHCSTNSKCDFSHGTSFLRDPGGVVIVRPILAVPSFTSLPRFRRETGWALSIVGLAASVRGAHHVHTFQSSLLPICGAACGCAQNARTRSTSDNSQTAALDARPGSCRVCAVVRVLSGVR